MTARFFFTMDLDPLLLQPPKGRNRWILIRLLLLFRKIPQDRAARSPRDDFADFCDFVVFSFKFGEGRDRPGGIVGRRCGLIVLGGTPASPALETQVYAKVLYSATPAGAKDSTILRLD
jgi:hypothetical protein